MKVGNTTTNFVLKALNEDSDKYLVAKRVQDLSKKDKSIFILKPPESLSHISEESIK